MIRRRSNHAELGLDSLTDTMTNMMGLILLMVAIVSIVSGGMRITLSRSLSDPGARSPVYMMCRDRQVLFMHRGNQWKKDLESVCRDLEGQLGRTPTTGEALVQVNTQGLSQSPDCQSIYVRETARLRGRPVYVIGVRFLESTKEINVPSFDGRRDEIAFSPSAVQALASIDADSEYIDAFVCGDGFDALHALEVKAQEQQIPMSWRPLDRHENPGLSDFGTTSGVEEMK